MTTDEMLKMLENWMATLRPLYLQLHTWTNTTAEKFSSAPVPKNPRALDQHRWAQEWPGLVEAANIDKYFEAENRNGSSRQPSNFIPDWVSRRCRKSFGKNQICIRCRLTRSARRNTHASCWHIDLENDIRRCKASSLTRGGFSLRITTRHGYYFKAYTRPEVPYLLRLGGSAWFP